MPTTRTRRRRWWRATDAGSGCTRNATGSLRSNIRTTATARLASSATSARTAGATAATMRQPSCARSSGSSIASRQSASRSRIRRQWPPMRSACGTTSCATIPCCAGAASVRRQAPLGRRSGRPKPIPGCSPWPQAMAALRAAPKTAPTSAPGGGAVPKPTASHPPWARSAWAVTPHPLRIALLARCRWIWECRPRQHRKPRLPPCRQWVVVWERTAHRKPLMLSHLLPVHCPLPPQQVPPRTNWPMAPQIACRETPQTRPREAPQMVPRMAPWTASQMTLQRAHWMAPRTRSWTTPRVRTACPRPTLQRHRRRWRHFNRQPTVAWTLMQTPRRSVPRCRIGSCPRRSPHPRSRLRMAITSDRDLGPLVMRRRRRYPSRPSQSHRQGVAVACQLRLRACRRSPPPPPLPPHRSQ